MRSKIMELSNYLDNDSYDNLSKEVYANCGFSEVEARNLMDVYHAVTGVWHIENEDLISFVKACLEVTDNTVLQYYFSFYLMLSYKNRERYNSVKVLAELAINHRKMIYDADKGYLAESSTLNQLLELCTKMNVRVKDLLDVVYHYCNNTGEIACFTRTISHAINKTNDMELSELFTCLHIKKIERLLSIKDVHSLDNYFKMIADESDCIFKVDEYKSTLFETYLELGNTGRDLIAMSHIQRAAEGFKSIGSRKGEERALGALESLINENDIEWQEMEVKYEDEEIQQIEGKLKLLGKYLNNKEFKDIIEGIHKGVEFVLKVNEDKRISKNVYLPFPNYEDIKAWEQPSVTDKLFSHSTIGDGRVMKKSKEPKNRQFYYNFNMGVYVLPIMKHLESDILKLMESINNLIKSNEWMSDSTKDYFAKIVEYYDESKTFEFMHFSVILIEKLMRDIYKSIKGTQIISMKTDMSAQVNVNLQDILKDDEIKHFLGESLYKYVEFNLVDDRGPNLRNEILHGLTEIGIFNHDFSRLLLHIILVLISFTNDKLESNSGGET